MKIEDQFKLLRDTVQQRQASDETKQRFLARLDQCAHDASQYSNGVERLAYLDEALSPSSTLFIVSD